MSTPKFEIILDTRYKKSNGLFPVKLKVFCLIENKKQTNRYSILKTPNLLHKNGDKTDLKKYPKIDEFSESVFNKIITASNKNNLFITENEIFKQIVSNAEEIAKTIEPFSFQVFEKLMLKKQTNGQDAFTYFNEIIAEKTKNGKVSTSEKYELAKKSITKFLESEKLNTEKLYLNTVNKKFLENVR